MRSLFSQSWHSVAELKPRLIPGAQIHRHIYRGQVWYVVQDHAGGRYHRFSAAAHVMIARMDGATTVQALWDRACQEAPEEIPTQNEVVDLLVQLHAADLLQADITPDAATLFDRYKNQEPAPFRDRPGFTLPRKVRVQYVNPKADLPSYYREAVSLILEQEQDAMLFFAVL